MSKGVLTARNPKQIVWCERCDNFVGFYEDLKVVHPPGDLDVITCPECHKVMLSAVRDIRWRPPEASDLPKRWVCIKRTDKHPLYGVYRFNNKLAAMMSIDIILNKEVWLHVSASYKDHVPSYEDLKHIKSIFIGDNNDAYHAFPRKERHVNLHPFCLHLWHRLDGPTMPDFRYSENMI